MMPFYGYTDSAYPMLPNQYHHHPGFEAVPPPYMTGDVPRPGGGYGHPCPFYGNNVMGYPGLCHSCGSFPGGVHPSPPQFHCCGYQSPFPGAGNAHCVVPPPYYVMQQPRYEYDKRAPGERHCCGCPNHAHSERSDRDVKVEEEPEPDAGKKEIESLVPFRSDGNQYPTAWTPNEQAKAPKPTRDANQSEIESRVPNGWFPLDPKSLESLLRTGGVPGGEERQFPFPVVWFPAKNMETMANKEVSRQGQSTDKSEQQLPSVPEFLPVNKLPDQREESKELQKLQERNDGKANPGLEMKKHNNSPRIIEVKQISSPTECNSDVNQSVAREASEASLKKQSSSSAGKPSKLPPVCLRVEPLSKKKNGKGASRSPSPPKSKSSSPRSQLEANLKRDLQGRNVEAALKLALDTREVSEPNGEDGEKSSVKAGDPCSTEATEPKEAVKAACGGSEAEKNIITAEEAALHIQSVYRGYNVRRWEPLKKLEQIARVREQLTDVRSRIDTLDSSDLQKADKQTLVIGEMIMSLLLKLDTIQGLHPIIRDMRKSVARELVALQERLDTIKVENEISRAKHTTSPMLGSGEVGGVNEQEPVHQDGNNEMLEARDAENRDLSFPADDVQESKLGSEISGGQTIVGLQDSERESNYAPEIKHEEMSDFEAIASSEMEATSDVCSEEDSPENSTPTRAFCCLADGKGIPEEPSTLESLPGLPMEHKMFENPEQQQECTIVDGNDVGHGVLIDTALSHEECNLFNVDKHDSEHEMNKSISTDGSENLADGEPQYANESLEFSESKESPSFDLKEQQEREQETKDGYSVGEEEGEAENPSENSESATSEEAEQQTEYHEAVNGRPYSEALQTEKLHACPGLPDLCDGEGCYDRDVEVNPAPEQRNVGDTHREDELLTNEDGNIAEEVKALEEAQVAEQSEMAIDIDEDIVVASDAADTKDDEDGVGPSSVPSSDTTRPIINDDLRLAEENAKLRETMEKLIEAGKEQLIVISNLTGRVKDLEQKLSRRKRSRTRRCRTARSPLSRSRAPMNSNNGALPTL